MYRTGSHYSKQSLIVVLTDLACLLAGGAIAVAARVGTVGFGEYFFSHSDGWLVFLGSAVLANYLAGSYALQNTFSRFNLLVTSMFSLGFALIMLSIMSYAWFSMLLGRGVLLLWVTCYGVISLSLKMFVFRRLFRSPMFLCRAAIVGCGPQAAALRGMLENPYVMPAHKVVAFVRLRGGAGAEPCSEDVEDVPLVECEAEELAATLRSLRVTLVSVGRENMSRLTELYPMMRRLRFEGMEIMTPLGVAELYSGRTPLDSVNEEALTQQIMDSDFPTIRRVKRLVDICLSVAAGLLLLLPLLLFCLFVKAGEPRSPVFYSQTRVGLFGKPFRIFKLRTMNHGAETESGPVWAQENDPRITSVGRVLRRYRMDEIPQLLNVVRGDMSIVGPRPERPAICVELAKQIPFLRERENVLPGLTGWAQVRYPYGRTIEDVRRKLEYDLFYIKHVSLRLDLQIILSTLRIVVFGKNQST